MASSLTDARSSSPPTASPREFLATFAVVFGLILAFLALDLWLARVERREARQHAANLYRDGRAQLEAGHPAEAADRLSSAVSLDRSNVAYALGLAQAMAAQGRTTEAEQMLDALLDRARNDGAVNLTMARLLASTHRARGATAFYHRAIYGQWGADSSSRRTAARFELIDLLVSQHARADLLAELLPLQTDSADSTTLLARVAPLYLKADAPGRAAEAFRALLRRSPSNAAAYVGLGDAALADGQFATARAAFRDAARVRAGDASIAARLRLADTLVALDPTARGLSDSQRLRRSRELLARTVRAVDACAPVVSSSGTTARDTALAQLGAASPRGGPAVAAERALALATGIWRGRPDACLPDSNESFDVLVLLQRSLTR